ncbi:hypothetical protein Tco_0474505 [Tanacetum coccineum]
MGMRQISRVRYTSVLKTASVGKRGMEGHGAERDGRRLGMWMGLYLAHFGSLGYGLIKCRWLIVRGTLEYVWIYRDDTLEIEWYTCNRLDRVSRGVSLEGSATVEYRTLISSSAQSSYTF